MAKLTMSKEPGNLWETECSRAAVHGNRLNLLFGPISGILTLKTGLVRTPSPCSGRCQQLAPLPGLSNAGHHLPAESHG
jgi:hypothetical protein